MRRIIGPICCLLLFLFCCASSEKLGTHKKKKLEQEAMHALMKKLENLYRLSATNNSEVLNKEIESLKKQIDQLHQHGGVIEGENLGHLLESEAANESTKKTIFGMDEDDLDNYDVDFTGQGKGKIKGQADTGQGAQETTGNLAAQAGGEASDRGGQQQQPARPSGSDSPGGVVEGGLVNVNTLQNVPVHVQSSRNGPQTTDPQPGPVANPSEGQRANETSQGVEGEPTVGPAVIPQPTSTVTTPERTSNSNDVKIKYMDKLYDDILSTSGKTNEIHIPLYHSKYNTIRKDYELSMKPVEYQIVKNLFNVGFKKEGESSAANSLTEVFKKVLVDEKFQDEFNNFVHGLYGFAKRHNYLGNKRLENTTVDSDLLKNAFSLMNTLEVA
ncbi:merozoite surface protein 7 [Plasmodium cynomolgi strain B]|uniref:Merozoite surface protein 7 n=2 Tax=Plasmodium cynomolgi TaxID=5827 RepID=K6UVV7_PLACD|nr:merozoite surface protein 7 [Plasmodium cynomolgi strain B]GAB67714.1 merozoite surface protein 7 [Plasmodium cynomolgi strain B]